MIFHFEPSPLPGPNTPGWLLSIVCILLMIVSVAGIGYGAILERKYKGPYTLNAASSKEKWRWAAMIVLWPSLLVPLMGWVAPILSPYSDQWPAFPLICTGVWPVIFAVGVLYKRLEMESTLRGYRRTDKLVKTRAFNYGPLSSRFRKLNRWFAGEEITRFYLEGYAENGDAEKEEEGNYLAAGATKVIRTPEDRDLERGKAWARAAHGRLVATPDNLYFKANQSSARSYGPESGLPAFEDFSIPVSDIRSAVLIETQQGLYDSLVLKVETADGYWYQFGLHKDPAWEENLPFPVERQSRKLKWSRYSVWLRVWIGLGLLVIFGVIMLVMYLVLR